MSAKLEFARAVVADHMDGILTAFKPGARIAVLVRNPGHPDWDFVMTNDSVPELIEMLKRRSDQVFPVRAMADGAPIA